MHQHVAGFAILTIDRNGQTRRILLAGKPGAQRRLGTVPLVGRQHLLHRTANDRFGRMLEKAGRNRIHVGQPLSTIDDTESGELLLDHAVECDVLLKKPPFGTTLFGDVTEQPETPQ